MSKRSEPLGDIASVVLFENEKVKIWNLIMEPGEASAWHLHERDYVTVAVEGGGLTVELEDGATGEITTRQEPMEPGRWRYHGDHRVHRVINNTGSRYKNVLVELKG